MDELFKALGDPTRRKILDMLRKKSMASGAIAENFKMSKPSVSHHLDILRSANLVKSTREGQNIFYTLNSSDVKGAISFLESINKKK